jgi:hypothetical protein
MVYNIKGSNRHPLRFICYKMPFFYICIGMSDISMEYIGAAYLCYLCLWCYLVFYFLDSFVRLLNEQVFSRIAQCIFS